MSDNENGKARKGISFDKLETKVSILYGSTFEILNDLLSATGTAVQYQVLPEGDVIADCEMDGISYCAMLIDSDGAPVNSVDAQGDTLLFRLVVKSPDETSDDRLVRIANDWNESHVSGRSFARDGMIFFEFRISLYGITAENFEDHLFEWYESIPMFLNFIVNSAQGDN